MTLKFLLNRKMMQHSKATQKLQMMLVKYVHGGQEVKICHSPIFKSFFQCVLPLKHLKIAMTLNFLLICKMLQHSRATKKLQMMLVKYVHGGQEVKICHDPIFGSFFQCVIPSWPPWSYLTNTIWDFCCCPRVVQQLTVKKKLSVIEVLKYFQSWTKSGGYMEGIWRLYKDDWRLYRNMEVIKKIWRLYMKYGGCIKIMEVVWNKGRHRAARAAKNWNLLQKMYFFVWSSWIMCQFFL